MCDVNMSNFYSCFVVTEAIKQEENEGLNVMLFIIRIRFVNDGFGRSNNRSFSFLNWLVYRFGSSKLIGNEMKHFVVWEMYLLRHAKY